MFLSQIEPVMTVNAHTCEHHIQCILFEEEKALLDENHSYRICIFFLHSILVILYTFFNVVAVEKIPPGKYKL